ncbi:MAG: hypothetical protein ACI9EK_002061 [Psychroserpens sp.]|jgi:hypothetical protein
MVFIKNASNDACIDTTVFVLIKDYGEAANEASFLNRVELEFLESDIKKAIELINRDFQELICLQSQALNQPDFEHVFNNQLDANRELIRGIISAVCIVHELGGSISPIMQEFIDFSHEASLIEYL